MKTLNESMTANVASAINPDKLVQYVGLDSFGIEEAKTEIAAISEHLGGRMDEIRYAFQLAEEIQKWKDGLIVKYSDVVTP